MVVGFCILCSNNEMLKWLAWITIQFTSRQRNIKKNKSIPQWITSPSQWIYVILHRLLYILKQYNVHSIAFVVLCNVIYDEDSIQCSYIYWLFPSRYIAAYTLNLQHRCNTEWIAMLQYKILVNDIQFYFRFHFLSFSLLLCHTL